MLIGIRTLGPLLLTATSLPVMLAVMASGVERLASMPPKVRLELQSRLDRFDLLPGDQQRQIRELDDALARLDPDERRRYLDLMRRYGAWYRGLDEPDRRELDSAPVADRLTRIEQRLGPGGSPESPGFDPALWMRADAFNPLPLYDAAAMLRTWVSLDDAGRARVEEARSFNEKLATLRQLGRGGQIEPAPAVRQVFKEILDTQVGFGLRKFREMFDEQARSAPRPAGDPAEAVSWLLDAFGTSRGRLPAPAASRLSSARMAALRVAELEYLRGLRNRPEGGPSSDLTAFEARLPEWYRGTLDSLPAEIARLRLRGLRELALSDPELERWLSSTPAPEPSRGRGPIPASKGAGSGRTGAGVAF
jgi:hypothetical protein